MNEPSDTSAVVPVLRNREESMMAGVAARPFEAADVAIAGGTFYSVARDFNVHNVHVIGGQPTGPTVDDVLRILKQFVAGYGKNLEAYHEISGKTAPGTGRGFMSKQEIVGWVEVVGRIIWLTGGPGSGKTYLLSSIFEQVVSTFVKTSNSVAAAIIYLQYHEDMTVWEVIVSIIIQLAESQPLPEVLDLIRTTLGASTQRSDTRPSLVQVVDTLRTIVAKYARCYIMLDDLDRMREEMQGPLVDVLLGLGANIIFTVRKKRSLLAASELEASRAGRLGFVAVTPQDVEEDVDLYITHVLGQTPRLLGLLDASNMKRGLTKTVKSRAEGIFSYIALQMEALRHCITIQEVLDVVEKTPPGMNALHADTIERIGRRPPNQAARANHALAWIVHAEGSLPLEDLQNAVSALPPAYKIQRNHILSEEDLVFICCGLVKIDSETGNVGLIHPSAYEALRGLLQVSIPAPNAMIARTCLERLKECGFQRSTYTILTLQDLNETIGNNSLLEYAYRTISRHIYKGVEEDESLRAPVLEFVRGCRTFPFYHPLFAKHSIPSSTSRSDVQGLSSLHVAALFDLPWVIVELGKDPGVDVNLKASRGKGEQSGWTSLMVAAARGHEGAVQALLDLPGTRVDNADSRGMTALMMAASGGYEGVIRLLLAFKARKPGRQAANKPTSPPPPSTAQSPKEKRGWLSSVWKGYRGRGVEGSPGHSQGGSSVSLVDGVEGGAEVGEDLWETVDVARQDHHGWSALTYARHNSRHGTIKLLSSAANSTVHSQQAEGEKMPLIEASKVGDEAAVKALLADPSIDVNQRNVDGWSPLQFAVDNGRVKVVELLLCAEGIRLELGSKERMSVLMTASEKGSAEVVKLLLAAPCLSKAALAQLVNKQTHDEEGLSALMMASRRGHRDVVKYLVKVAGVDVNLRTRTQGSTAIMLAAEKGHVDVVEVLLRVEGIQVNLDVSLSDEGYTDGQWTPLMRAALNGRDNVVGILLKEAGRVGLDVNEQRKKTGFCALMHAAQNGYTEVVEQLLAFPATNANLTDKDGCTALIVAANRGKEGVVRALLEADGVDVEKKSAFGWTALMYAAKNGTESVVRLLLDRPGVDINSHVSREGWTPLTLAAYHDRPGAARVMLTHSGVDVNHRKLDGWTALMVGAKHGGEEVVKALLQAPRVDVNVQSTEGTTALMIALINGRRDTARLLLGVRGIDVNLKKNNGWTALMFAAEKGEEEIAEMLLAPPHEVDVNTQNPDGVSVLTAATVHGRPAVVKVLLRATGINVNLRKKNGFSALMLAAEKGYDDIVQMLLQAPGVDVNLRNNDGATALIVATSFGRTNVVRLLLAAPGIQVSTQKTVRPGTTALILAAEKGDDEIVKLLLDLGPGVDVNQQDLNGWTALIRGSYHGRSERVVELLLNAPGIRIELTSRKGYWALMHAAQNGHLGIVKRLLAFAEREGSIRRLINWQGDDGWTPLMASMANGPEEGVVRALLEVPGIDLSIRNKLGRTAFEITEQKGFTGVTEVLRAAHNMQQGVIDNS